jgi:hypothetical protein
VLLLLFLLLLGVGIAMLVPCVGWLAGPGAFFFLVFSVTPLLAPIVMIEKRDVSTTLRRAWDLARRRFWWLLGFMFILMLFSQLVITGPTLAVNYFVRLLLGQQDQFQTTVITTIINSFVQLIAGTFYLPLQLTAYTLVYFDLRVRTEGFDLALLSMQISGDQPSLETIQELPVQLPSGKLVEWTDIGNFAILTIVGGGIYLLLVAVVAFLMVGVLGAAGGF